MLVAKKTAKACSRCAPSRREEGAQGGGGAFLATVQVGLACHVSVSNTTLQGKSGIELQMNGQAAGLLTVGFAAPSR